MPSGVCGRTQHSSLSEPDIAPFWLSRDNQNRTHTPKLLSLSFVLLSTVTHTHTPAPEGTSQGQRVPGAPERAAQQ